MSGQETSPQSPPANTNTPKHRRPWNSAEDATLRTLVGHFGASRGSEGRWKDIAAGLEGRTAKDCRKRWLHSLDPSLRKGRWTSQEDEILLSAYARLGPLWNDIASLIPGRKDDQCSKRYNDILNPSAKNRLSDWTSEEDNLLRQGVATLGHRWVAISSRIPGRPPLTCRNRWRTLSRQSQHRQSKSQGTTPSSSSQTSPLENGISPAPHNLNISVDANNGTTPDLMSFPTMDTDMGQSFLDSAFFDTFTGPSPSPLRESEPSDETETPNDATAPGSTGPIQDLSSNTTSQPQNAPKPWPQQPGPPQAQNSQNSTSAAFMPSPSTWSSLGTMLPPGTSPTDQNLWLGTTSSSSAPKDWNIPAPGDDPMAQTYTEQFQINSGSSQPAAVGHHGLAMRLAPSYRPLDPTKHQIRVLHLLPGQDSDPIRCELQIVSLSDSPSYEALSYSWGDPYICHVIEVDGQKAEITINLYNVLRRLRLSDRTRHIWADALCINQKDTIERTQQVGLMREVYSSTTEAILWLGDFIDNDNSVTGSADGTAVNLICPDVAATAFSLLRSMAANNHWNSTDHLNQAITETESDALSALLNLSWWQRAWTVQEAVLPKKATVYCGTISLSLTEVKLAHLKSVSHDRDGCCITNPQCHDVLYKFWDCVEGFRLLQEESDKAILVRMALEMFRFRHASDQRDCVYAYLGLGSKALADYTIPYETAFKYVVRSLIHESKNLGPLVRIPERSRSTTLPTWCPDYGSESFPETYENIDQEFGWLYMDSWYRAGGSDGPKTRFSLIDSRLDLQGIIVDRIIEADGPMSPRVDKASRVSEWQKRDPRVCQLGKYEEAGWCEMMRDIYLVFSDKPRDYIRRRTREGFATLINELWDPNIQSQIALFQYQTFKTQTGLVGHARVDPCVGDVAYVHGIMDGEALQQGRALEWITLLQQVSI
ncbi:hypothetical protein F53441_3700 [Fusarium austroafricanum]|uniref:Uncharacterized protein n=1 Tax=Fusarium austroafricanum TaxID=2364996 RepID=A0A8H4P2J3_9HYPO|nr:hypothetical protein F53441_3700 [Fusarium austroafricanum]